MKELIKVQFCCGSNLLPGWINHDHEVDISKSLPFQDDSCSHVFVEHGLEHITPRQAWNFLDECHRILAPGGKVRIAIPDIERIWSRISGVAWHPYIKAASKENTACGAIQAVIMDHGHQSCWTAIQVFVVMRAMGFNPVKLCDPGESDDQSLKNIEGHWKTVGKQIADTETSVVQGTKPISPTTGA